MFPYRMLAMIALLLLGGGAGAAAQEREKPRDHNCEDDRGVNRCDAEQQRKMRALYGLEPIETHLAGGDVVHRAMFVDGYGRDVVAISFVRPKGADPVLSVHAPADPDGTRPEALTAPVPKNVWDRLIERSQHFDRELAPPVVEEKPKPGKKREKPVTERTGGETITICLHSWVYVVEATEAPSSDRTAKVRRTVEDACEDGLAEVYARELANAAVTLLPPCALLDRKQHRNLPSLLRACTSLSGDRLAAAEVMNAVEVFRRVDRPTEAALLHGVFHYSIELDWQGTSVKGSRAAAETWATNSAGRAIHLFHESFEGVTPDEVRFVGFLSRVTEGPGGDWVHHRARVEQTWVRDAGRFEIRRASVGPWEKEP